MGLAIANAIVTAHGGRIWVEGTPGGGTAVVFEMPVEGAVMLEDSRERPSELA